MRICVIGANGFLGSWICRTLCANHEIFGLVRKDSSSRNLKLIQNIEIVVYDEESLAKSVFQIGGDALILADWSGVQNHERNSASQYENVERIRRRLNFIRAFPLVIAFGSQAEIGPHDHEIDEDAEENPTSVYGKAKVQVQLLLREGLNLDSTRFIWGRIFSTYGPLDSNSWFIPSLITSMIQRRSFPMTKGEQEWSYLHAFDLARSLETILSSDVEGIVNIGNPKVSKIVDVARAIAHFFDREDLLQIGAVPYRSDQVMRLRPNIQKLGKNGWEPIVEFDSGIQHLITWMQGYSQPELMLMDGTRVCFNLPNYHDRN